MRGLTRVQQQCLLAATAQNIKKIALMMSRMGPNTPLYDRFRRCYRPISACCAAVSEITPTQTSK